MSHPGCVKDKPFVDGTRAVCECEGYDASFATMDGNDDESVSRRTPTRVVHCKREPFDVCIGRPGPWGNQYVIGVDGDRDQCIELHVDYLRQHPELVERVRRELANKVLGCWCAPLACHGDVLARVANGEEP